MATEGGFQHQPVLAEQVLAGFAELAPLLEHLQALGLVHVEIA